MGRWRRFTRSDGALSLTYRRSAGAPNGLLMEDACGPSGSRLGSKARSVGGRRDGAPGGGWAALVLTLVTSFVQADRLFVGGDAFPLDSPGGSLRVDDYNRDGRPDVAIVYETRGEVGVLLGGVEPLLGAPVSYEAGLGVFFVTSGDLTNDGFPELVTVNTGASTVSVLLNQGDGTFVRTAEYPVGTDPRFGELADFNGDGALDFVTTNFTSGDLQVLLGDGAGSFIPADRIAVGDNPHHLTVNDFDGDGSRDVAVAHSGAVTWFRGLAGGAFERMSDIPLDPDPRVLTSGDFNEDGRQDLALVKDDTDFVLLLNAGDGRFDVRAIATIGNFTFGFGRETAGFLLPLDFDGDGFLDVAAQFSREGEYGVRVVHGAGDGTFRAESGFFLDAPTADLDFSDLDGDGLLDAVATRAGSPELMVFRGIRGGALGAIRTRAVIPLETAARDLAALDADRSGRSDLLVLTTGALTLIKVDAQGLFVDPVVQEFPGRALQNMTAADFDGDGRLDLALTDLAGSTLIIGFLDGGGAVERTLEHLLPSLPADLTASDFDGDGVADVATAPLASSVLMVVLRPGFEGQAEVVELPVGERVTTIASGDLDDDGRQDIVAATTAGLQVFFGNGAGGFPRGLRIDGFAASRGLRIADVDLDGASELVIADTVSGRLVVLSGVREGADPASPPAAEIDVGRDLRGAEVVDIDVDGRPDLVTASSRSVVVVRASDDGAYSAPLRFAIGSNPRAILAADFNLDGRPDLVTADFGSRGVSILRSDTTSESSPAFRRADANGDGAVGLTDAVAILERLFSGRAMLACPDAADADDDGVLALTDAVRVLLYLFGSGSPPPAPGPEACGEDPTPDALSPCERGC